MRKRKYAHLKNQRQVPDHVTEDIDAFYVCLEDVADRVVPLFNVDSVERVDVDDVDRVVAAERRQIISKDEKNIMPIASIHNLVATARIKSTCAAFDLHTISQLLPNSSYDKQKFAAITVRLHQPHCTILLFTSGKMVLTGCKDYAECCWASLNMVSLLRVSLPHFGFTLQEVIIQNIVGNVDLMLGKTHRLNLDRLYREENVFCTYQKNMFPGLIYRANQCPVVLLLFCSGKIVITGGKSRRDILDGWASLWPLVRQYIDTCDVPAPECENFRECGDGNIKHRKYTRHTSHLASEPQSHKTMQARAERTTKHSK